MLRFAFSLVVLFAVCLSASAATLVTTETFDYYYSPFPGGYNNGWNSTRNTVDSNNGSYSYLDGVGSPWFDPSNPWFANWSSTSTSNNVSSYDSTTFFLDNSQNAGIGPYMFSSVTNSINTYLNKTTYPLQEITHIDGHKYTTRDTTISMGIYSFDCRDLVNAGLSGGCVGSDVGFRQTTNLGLGGIWFSFDINMNDGTIFNYNRGDINPWENITLELWNRNWPSEPFNQSNVPEPGTYGTIGVSLTALALARRRPFLIRTGLTSRSGKIWGKR